MNQLDVRHVGLLESVHQVALQKARRRQMIKASSFLDLPDFFALLCTCA